MTDRLKPCPFCGGEAEVSLLLGNYGVACTECMGAVFPARGMTKEEAIEMWNTRKPMDSIVERLEKVKKYNEESYEEWEGSTVAQNYRIKADSYKHSIEIVKEGGK